MTASVFRKSWYNSNCIVFSIAITLSCLIPTATAILPTAAVDVTVPASDGTSTSPFTYTLFASQGNFATILPMTPDKNQQMTPALPPQEDPLLCDEYADDNSSFSNQFKEPFVLVVPRGSCTFEHKAIKAQLLGASGIIIYGTLSSRYAFNETKSEMLFPQELYDYDCSTTKGGGRVEIPKSKLVGFDNTDGTTPNIHSNRPYNSANDNLLSGSKESGNLCAIYADDEEFKGCSSKKCLLTGNQTTASDTNVETVEACCAWDTHIFLYHDDAMTDKDTGKPLYSITIPAYYLEMEQADKLFDTMNANNGKSFVTMYSRWYPKYNLATVVIWAVGVFVAALASYLSASEIRYARKQLEKSAQENDNGDTSNEQQNNINRPAVSARGYEPVSNGGGEYRRSIDPEETLELTAMHAVFFIFVSSAGLLTLFIFKIYNVVKIFYAFGCSGAIMQVIFLPLYFYIAMKFNFRDRVAFATETADIGSVTLIELSAFLTSYGLGAVWIYLAFAVHHPETIPFFWIMQNIMGACMCILFLQTMKLNSIKVASILLTAAFFYDIFFVFVTPLLTKGGKSIMVDVATSGGPPTADPSWCEKYPEGPECQGGDPLPMLFTIPRINDFAGGSSLLGLGDIVLPGLLLSFASRYDEAKALVGSSHSPRPSPRSPHETCSKKGGYFIPSVIAYAIGLSMANVAVYVMRMGQPALLYLVPCCLGTIVYLGWKRGELVDLWNTPKVLASCDKILYGVAEEQESLAENVQDESHVQDLQDENSTQLELL